jgi:hypothetical protein
MYLWEDMASNVFAFTDPFLALEHFKLNLNDYDLVLSDARYDRF